MVNKTSLGFVEYFFTSIAVDMPVISVVENYFQLGLKYLNPLKKVISLYLNHCTAYIHGLLQHSHS